MILFFFPHFRLNITTRALDVVYNPQVLKRITEFFSLHHNESVNDFSLSELKLTAAARARYEVLKQQTKAELQHKWDQILDGEDKTVSELSFFFLFFSNLISALLF